MEIGLLRWAAHAIRWWFGATWIVAGVACLVAAPVDFAFGDAGAFYFVVGGVMLIWLGWFVLPNREVLTPRALLARLGRHREHRDR
jgi:hypothetical protein